MSRELLVRGTLLKYPYNYGYPEELCGVRSQPTQAYSYSE